MRARSDGGSLIKALEHYCIKPYTDPVGFWSGEIKHAIHTVVDPIGHRVGHNRAGADALRDGRPIDAAVAFAINDKWESSDNQTRFAKDFYGIKNKDRR